MLRSRVISIENAEYLASHRCGWNYWEAERLADGHTWRFPTDPIHEHEQLRERFHAFLATL